MSFLAHYISKTATLNACFLILYIIYIYICMQSIAILKQQQKQKDFG